MSRTAKADRKTKETNISLAIDMEGSRGGNISMGLPFFEHMLNAMAFHGNFLLEVKAQGDIEVDPHHLVEDVGLVLGQTLADLRKGETLARFGHAVVPMDESLAEVCIDASGRPYLIYQANYSQERAGTFDIHLLKEFFHALAFKGGMNIHALCRYGENVHHMAEALFKALGRALGEAYTPLKGPLLLSTKGKLD